MDKQNSTVEYPRGIESEQDEPVILSRCEPSYDELIELLKKTDRITVQKPKRRMLYWADAWCKWAVRSKSVELYRGDSLIEALKILTRGA